jgi:SAM-dependent methyltransferase
MALSNFDRVRCHWDRLISLVGPSYPLLLVRTRNLAALRDLQHLGGFRGHGLEIGGPSEFFQPGKGFSIYSAAEALDNVNYSGNTFWEGAIQEGRNFKYHANKAVGRQFIREASELSSISDCEYDFVASCHVLEHCANPIKALNEWRRVIRNDGCLSLVLPHKLGTFDHRRRVTEFEHLLEDYSRGVTEDDKTHFAEILEKHDLERDPGRKSRAEFVEWIMNNPAVRGAHHHVFDPALAITLVDYAGFEVFVAEVVLPFHILILARKTTKSRAEKETLLSQVVQACYASSPFALDRRRRLPPARFGHRSESVTRAEKAMLEHPKYEGTSHP